MKYIKEITGKQTYCIRKEVLRKGIDLPYKFDGDNHQKTIHLGAFKKKKLIGVVSFMHESLNEKREDEYQLRGMATIIDVRGDGFGSLLVKEGIQILLKRDIKYIWCNAREGAVKFYERNGFKIVGTPFNVKQIGVHYKMKLKIG